MSNDSPLIRYITKMILKYEKEKKDFGILIKPDQVTEVKELLQEAGIRYILESVKTHAGKKRHRLIIQAGG